MNDRDENQVMHVKVNSKAHMKEKKCFRIFISGLDIYWSTKIIQIVNSLRNNFSILFCCFILSTFFLYKKIYNRTSFLHSDQSCFYYFSNSLQRRIPLNLNNPYYLGISVFILHVKAFSPEAKIGQNQCSFLL